MTIRPRRSVLYMPGSNARAMEKAKSLACDAVIFDLEDSVAPDAKAEARQLVCDMVKAGGYGPRELIIRINPLTSEWGAKDIVLAATTGADAILIPKVESGCEIRTVAEQMENAGASPNCAIWAMIETPRAVLNIADIAQSREKAGGERLNVFILGTNDLAKESRAQLLPGRAAFLPWLMQVLAGARCHGIEIIDGVYNQLDNAAGFIAECEQGLTLGMDGKTLIHPSQITPCNEIFSPPEAEIAWARKIIDAFNQPENHGKGVIRLEGKMVELLHAEMAKRTIAIAEAIADKET